MMDRKLVTAVLLISTVMAQGCVRSLFYNVYSGDNSKMTMVHDTQGGIPVHAFYRFCSSAPSLYRDSNEKFYFVCKDYGDDSHYYKRIIAVGPNPELNEVRVKAQDSYYESVERTLKKLGYTNIPLASCGDNQLCSTNPRSPYLMRMQRKEYEYHIEYADFSEKYKVYSSVMNGGDVSLLTPGIRSKYLEEHVVVDAVNNIKSCKNVHSNRALLQLVTGKDGPDLDTFIDDAFIEYVRKYHKDKLAGLYWRPVAPGCMAAMPPIITTNGASIITEAVWKGKCVDGKADGPGTLVISYDGSKTQTSSSTTKGTMRNGRFEGKVENSVPLGSSSYASVTSTVWLHDRAQMSESVYRDASRAGRLDSIALERDFSIMNAAKVFDVDAMAEAYSRGVNVNVVEDKQRTALFAVIDAVREAKAESIETIAVTRWLIENGADLNLKLNPQPKTFQREMTAQQYLLASSGGSNTVPPPPAPQIAALFSDAKVLERNKSAQDRQRYARDLGMSHFQFTQLAREVDKNRSRGTFEGYADAFLATRSKNDFVKAQAFAKSPAERSKMEYLAVLATADKRLIFNLKTKLNGVEGKASDATHRGKFLFFISNDTKETKARFTGQASILTNTASPVKLHSGYKVTVKYTFRAQYRAEQTALMHKGMNEYSETVVQEKTFILPVGKSEAKVDLDFGEYTIASTNSSLFGLNHVTTKLLPNSTVEAEIVSVQML